MTKGHDGGKQEKKEEKKRGKKKKIPMKIVATTSLPAVNRPNADRWNAARSRQYTLMAFKIHYKHGKNNIFKLDYSILIIFN